MKNAVSETKNTLKGINRLHEAADRISDLEDGVAEDTQSEQQREKRT